MKPAARSNTPMYITIIFNITHSLMIAVVVVSIYISLLANLMASSAWNLLSFELVLFVSVLYLYMQIRKSNILSLRPIRGLTVYVPPMDEDFELLDKTNKGGRENKRGEVNKYDKKKLPSKAKFPLRTIEINEAFLKHNQEFFVEYDFFFMLFSVLLVLFAFT